MHYHFPLYDVRTICFEPFIDSYKDPDSLTNIAVPITNVINDNFCLQTSKKIRQVFDHKRRKGDFIGAFAPYGYAKDPQNKTRLIFDEEDHPALSVFIKSGNFQSLTRELLLALVDCIYVKEGGRIAIQFKFHDRFERISDLIKTNGKKLTDQHTDKITAQLLKPHENVVQHYQGLMP